MADTRQHLQWTIEDAFSGANAEAHERIRSEQETYRTAPRAGIEWVGKIASPAGESLDPQTTKLVQKMMPRLEESAPPIQILPDRSTLIGEEAALAKELGKWFKMYEEVDNEQDRMRTTILHNCVGGMAIRKTYWDDRFHTLTSPAINPVNFAPQQGAIDISLRDADYVVHKTKRSAREIKRRFPKFRFRSKTGYRKPDPRGEEHIVNEVWMHREYAEDIGIKVPKVARNIVVAWIIEDRIASVRPSPFMFPHFPFACWRYLQIFDDSGRPNEWWGYGLPSLLKPQQKLLDCLLANLVLLLRKQTTGRLLAPKGMFDNQVTWDRDSALIRYDKEAGFNPADILDLPIDQIPPTLPELIKYITHTMEQLSGITGVTTGQEPAGANISGRAIVALQSAAATQMVSNVSAMNEFRGRVARQKAVLIQQAASKPIDLNLWRGGVDIVSDFPAEARHIGFTVHVPDAASLPQTPAGKAQIIQLLNEMFMSSGSAMKPEKVLELLGIDQSYGITIEDFIQPAAPQPGAPAMGNMPINESALQDLPASPDAV